MRRKEAARKFVMPIASLAVFALYLFPVYWMFVSGLKPPYEIFKYPPSLFPSHITLGAFSAALAAHYFRFLANSLIIACSTTLLTLLLSAPAAYAMARLQKAWVKWLLLAFVVAQLLPPVLMATPMFIMFHRIGLINNYLSVIFANATQTVAFSIIMLRPVFSEIPIELEEAAFMDGAQRPRVFLSVVLPMSRSGMAVIIVVSFIFAYQDFVYSLSFLTKESMLPTTVGLYSFIGAQAVSWDRVMAFASLACLPLIVIFVLLQRQILRGLSAGALKS